jgi:hypothetical protein
MDDTAQNLSTGLDTFEASATRTITSPTRASGTLESQDTMSKGPI